MVNIIFVNESQLFWNGAYDTCKCSTGFRHNREISQKIYKGMVQHEIIPVKVPSVRRAVYLLSLNTRILPLTFRKISFIVCAQWFSRVRLFVTPWTVALQAPLSIGILQARILEWVSTPFFYIFILQWCKFGEVLKLGFYEGNQGRLRVAEPSLQLNK